MFTRRSKSLKSWILEITQNTRSLKSRKFRPTALKSRKFFLKSRKLWKNKRKHAKMGQIRLFFAVFRVKSRNYGPFQANTGYFVLFQGPLLVKWAVFKGSFFIFNFFGVIDLRKNIYTRVNYLLDKILLIWGHHINQSNRANMRS